MSQPSAGPAEPVDTAASRQPSVDQQSGAQAEPTIKEEARKRFNRICDWGLANSMKQSHALAQVVTAKQLGSSGEEGGQQLDPAKIAELMEQLPFGSSINSLNIYESAPAAQTTPAASGAPPAVPPTGLANPQAAPQAPLTTTTTQQPMPQTTAAVKPGLNPWVAAGLTALGLAGGAGATYLALAPEPPPKSPVVQEFDGVIEWEHSSQQTTNAQSATQADN